MIEKILEFAIKHHENQMYGDKPYIFHIKEVHSECISFGLFVEIIAILHDIKEDTKVTDQEIIDLLLKIEATDIKGAQFIIKSLYYISDEEGSNRKERKQKTNLKLANIPIEFYSVLIAKTADRFCNTKNALESNSNLFNMYKREYPEFKKSVYREGLCESLWLKLDSLMNQ